MVILNSSNSSKKEFAQLEISRSTGNISQEEIGEILDNIQSFTSSASNNIIELKSKGTLPVIKIVDTPDNFDLFKQYPNLITPALDQAVCGDCYTFATSTAVSDMLRIAIHKYNIANKTNIKFPLNEWVSWFFTLQGATYKAVARDEGEKRFDLPNRGTYKYPVLNNISPWGMAILSPAYDFFGYKGLLKGSICGGGNPILTLEVLLAWNFLPNECRLGSLPPDFPNWTRARYINIKDATKEEIQNCNDISGDRLYLCPNNENPKQIIDTDKCGNVFNGGCPITYMDDYLHKFIPVLLTGFSCDELNGNPDTNYCYPIEEIAALYFLQMPYSDFNYQINGFNILCQRSSKTLNITFGSDKDIKNVIKSYLYQYGSIIVNMRISSTFFEAYIGGSEIKNNLFSQWDKGNIYYPVDVVNEINKGISPSTYPVFSLPFGDNMGIHSVNIVGWGKCQNSKGIIKDYWKVRNSWGTSWGDEGNFMILDENNQLDTYICTLSTLAININNQINRIVDHYGEYELLSSKDHIIDVQLVSQYFDRYGSANLIKY